MPFPVWFSFDIHIFMVKAKDGTFKGFSVGLFHKRSTNNTRIKTNKDNFRSWWNKKQESIIEITDYIVTTFFVILSQADKNTFDHV